MEIKLPPSIKLNKQAGFLETDWNDYHRYHHLFGAYHWNQCDA